MILELKKRKCHCLCFATVKKTLDLFYSHQYGVAVSKMAPQWSCLLVFTPLGGPSLSVLGLVLVTSRIWQKRWIEAAILPLTAPLSLFTTLGKSATMSCEHFLPCGSGQHREELRPPADNHVTEPPGVGSPGLVVPPVTAALNTALTATLWEPWSQNYPVKLFLDSWPPETNVTSIWT